MTDVDMYGNPVGPDPNLVAAAVVAEHAIMNDTTTKLKADLDALEAKFTALEGHVTALIAHRVDATPGELQAAMGRLEALSARIEANVSAAAEALTK